MLIPVVVLEGWTPPSVNYCACE